jgi:hypothetical protein
MAGITSKRNVKAGKLTPEQVHKSIRSEHEQIRKAAHGVLEKAGLRGVKIHSIQYSVPRSLVTEPMCNPPCEDDERCVIDNDGGQSRPVCIKK